MIFTKGMRDKLDKYIDVESEFNVEMSIDGGSTYDFSCFGVDANGKLSDDRYMVFYNQISSPQHEIEFSGNEKQAVFKLNLFKIPESISKLVFIVSIDGNGRMGDIDTQGIKIQQGSSSLIEMNFSGSEFKNEKAIISIEIYRKDCWRIAAVANGFNGGLSALLSAFGGQEVPAGKQTIQKPVQKPEQIKKQEENKSEKVSLKKGQKVSLRKNASKSIIIENGWTAKGKDYDLKALVRYRDGRLVYIGAANKDEYLSTSDGAVKHGGDVKNPGDLEHIEIKWNSQIASVAVSSYSALENGTGSFQRYGVFVRIKNGNQTIEIPATDTSANDRSYTLCFGEILYGDEEGMFDVMALEMYSRPNSENRIGYRNNEVVMDIGPAGKNK